MIKLLADEKFPSASIDQLNSVGLDTLSILKCYPTTPARLVIEILNNKQLDFERSIIVIEENFIRQIRF